MENASMAPVPADNDGQETYPFEFHGHSWEYFKIWSVNLLLTVLTFGIFSAWAKVRNRRYFYGNTFLNGANFEYHAKPLAILFARLIVMAIFLGGAIWAGEDLLRGATHALLLAFFLPWALVRGLAFNARYSSYRNVPFGFNKGEKVYIKIYLIYLPFILLVLVEYLNALDALSLTGLNYPPLAELIGYGNTAPLLLFLLLLSLSVLPLPWMVRGYQRLKAENHRWGRLAAGFTPPAIGFYMFICWVMPVLAVAALTVLYFSALYVIGVNASIEPGAGKVLLGATVFISYVALVMVVSLMFVLLFRLYWQALVLPGGGRVECRFSVAAFAIKILLVNYFAFIFSFGLLYPWTKVRKTRFLVQHMQLVMPAGAMDNVLADKDSKEGAFGEEFGAAEGFGFGFDFGLI